VRRQLDRAVFVILGHSLHRRRGRFDLRQEKRKQRQRSRGGGCGKCGRADRQRTKSGSSNAGGQSK
jgi:hypothetical protein